MCAADREVSALPSSSPCSRPPWPAGAVRPLRLGRHLLRSVRIASLARHLLRRDVCVAPALESATPRPVLVVMRLLARHNLVSGRVEAGDETEGSWRCLFSVAVGIAFRCWVSRRCCCPPSARCSIFEHHSLRAVRFSLLVSAVACVEAALFIICRGMSWFSTFSACRTCFRCWCQASHALWRRCFSSVSGDNSSQNIW